jgi:hypothetical protein
MKVAEAQSLRYAALRTVERTLSRSPALSPFQLNYLSPAPPNHYPWLLGVNGFRFHPRVVFAFLFYCFLAHLIQVDPADLH